MYCRIISCVLCREVYYTCPYLHGRVHYHCMHACTKNGYIAHDQQDKGCEGKIDAWISACNCQGMSPCVHAC